MNLFEILNKYFGIVTILIILAIIIFILIKSKTKKQQHIKPTTKSYLNYALTQDYEPYPEKKGDIDYFKELDKEIKEFERLKEKLKKTGDKLSGKNTKEKSENKEIIFKPIPNNNPITFNQKNEKKDNFWKIFSILLILSFVFMIFTFWYGIKNDKFKSILNSKCEGVNISTNCPQCPACPTTTCPNLSCPNINFTYPELNSTCNCFCGP